MKQKVLRIAASASAMFLLPLVAQAQEKGLDQRIDDAFKPVADWFEAVVFTKLPLSPPFDVPIVLFLLIFGAAFFTVAFGFVNIRRFALALRVVSGKYDSVDSHAASPKAEVEMVDGDITRTAADESRIGEVSHFQALATAVSGTVGLGNIAGVAVAVAVGGPGATFWMIVCGLLGMSSKFVECTLGVKYRDISADGTVHGGPMYYLSRGFQEIGLGPVGKVFGFVFAILCIGASFGGGNAFRGACPEAQAEALGHPR